MIDQPLTDTEAAVLRALGLGISLTFDHLVERGLARTGTVPCMTNAGSKALKDYDERKRREIRVEAFDKLLVRLRHLRCPYMLPGEGSLDVTRVREHATNVAIREVEWERDGLSSEQGFEKIITDAEATT